MEQFYYNDITDMTPEGNLEKIAPTCRKNKENNPNNGDVYYDLGIKLNEQGRTEEAIDCYRNAIRINPHDVDAFYNMGTALNTLGKTEEAIGCYKKVLELNPGDYQTHNNMGMTLKGQLKHEKAIYYFQKAIEINPEYILAYNNMGITLFCLGKSDEALARFRKAIKINPNNAEAYNNMGIAFKKLGQTDQAITCFQKAIKLNPKQIEAFNNLGNIYYSQGEIDKAISCYLNVIKIKPDDSNAYFNMGNAFNKLKDKAHEAISLYQKTLEITPKHTSALNNLGNILIANSKVEIGLQYYYKALKINPDDPNANYNIGLTYHFLCRSKKGLTFLHKALKLNPDFNKAHSNILYYLNFFSDYSHSNYLLESKKWWQIHGISHANSFEHKNHSNYNRPLKIGYVSPNFHQHSVSYFFLPLLIAHNRNKFEIFCYSDSHKSDEVAGRIRDMSDHWISSSSLSDDALTDHIYKNSIDILVDLAGHTGENRMPVFARKPAPIQVNWLGYPNTTGLPVMDYRFTDEIADPEGKSDSDYTETLIRLPNGFLCYSPLLDVPEITNRDDSDASSIKFGSFNNLAKINREVISLWSAILQKIPGSSLVLKTKELMVESTKNRYLDMFLQNKIESNRITMISHVPSHHDHLSLYNDVDICLDPFPYNGTTTTCEALWMGTPVITLCGDRHASRVGADILSRINMHELIAEDEKKYALKAIELANNPSRLAMLRNSLRQRMEESPLCDSKRFAHDIETAFKQIWVKWCEEHEGNK